MSPRAESSARFTREEKLTLASLVVVVGFLAAVVFHYWQGAYEGAHYPHDTYLFRPSDTLHFVEPVGTRRHAFSDLLAVCIHARARRPYSAAIPAPEGAWRPFPSNYPPLGAMIAWPLTLVPYRWAIAAFLTCSVAGMVAFGWRWFRVGKPALDAIHIVALCLMPYPVHVLLDRGNIEIAVFAVLAVGAAFLARRRCGPAAGALGTAVALKIFPAVYLPLLLHRCGRRGVAVCVGVAAVTSCLALLAMASPPWESVRQFVEILFGFSGKMDESLNSATLSSGLYAPVAVVGWYAETYPSLRPLAAVLRTSYPALAVALFAGAAWLTLAGRLRLWEAATLATLCMVALPKASPDYRLIHLLIPLALFVHSRASRGQGIAVTTLFGLLLVPKAWLWIAPEVSIGAVVNPACMVALAGVVVWGAMRRRQRSGQRPPRVSPREARSGSRRPRRAGR